MKRVLSFDCANRSLAVCYASINKNTYAPLMEAIQNSKDNKELYLDYVQIHFVKVFDITSGKKFDTVQKSILLKTQLQELDAQIKTESDKLNRTYGVSKSDEPYSQVLIEYQMSVNDKSRAVSQQLVYHYCDKANVYLVGPTLKNKIDLSADRSLSYGDFIAKYSSKYIANKNHTKQNFLHYLYKTELSDIINPIKKKNYDDIADSFAQIIGFTNCKTK